MVHIQAPEHRKIMVYERAGGCAGLLVVWNDESGVPDEGWHKTFGVETAWTRAMGPDSPASGYRKGFDGQDN
jgi:hypothetical protein